MIPVACRLPIRALAEIPNHQAEMLCYCTNVHPSESLEELHRALAHGARDVRLALGWEMLDVGLYLSAQSAQKLAEDPEALAALSATLREEGLRSATINAFPYGNFHAASVKESVYLPDWTNPERLQYTLNVAHVLAHLMGEASYGSISTVAIGIKGCRASLGDHLRVIEHLVAITCAFAKIEAELGKRLVLSLEPEPFTELETTSETIRFFEDELLLRGISLLCEQDAEITAAQARELILRHIGICYDCCHQAVEFELARTSLSMLRAAGITIGKVQLSNALSAHGQSALELLEEFDEPRYLHQSFVQIESAQPGLSLSMPELQALAERNQARMHQLPGADQALISCLDLPQTFRLLDDLAERSHLARVIQVRTHFHTPLFWDGAEGASGQRSSIGSTQAFLREVLECHAESALSEHLEIETYSWGVLPEGFASGDLAQGIAREFGWVQDCLSR